jgi:hypothetical protein
MLAPSGATYSKSRCRPAGAKKNNHPHFYKHFAPPGLGIQNPLASEEFNLIFRHLTLSYRASVGERKMTHIECQYQSIGYFEKEEAEEREESISTK